MIHSPSLQSSTRIWLIFFTTLAEFLEKLTSFEAVCCSLLRLWVLTIHTFVFMDFLVMFRNTVSTAIASLLWWEELCNCRLLMAKVHSHVGLFILALFRLFKEATFRLFSFLSWLMNNGVVVVVLLQFIDPCSTSLSGDGPWREFWVSWW